MLERIRLETASGEYVCTGEIPPFNEWPAVVLWGTRIFQLVTTQDREDAPVYRECFSVAVVKYNFEDGAAGKTATEPG